jgi:excinuclease ABC subunit B
MSDTDTRSQRFRVVSDYEPAGDQPQAVAALSAGIERGERFQTLLGITGSGKSATIAWTIEQVQRPTLILAPNKSLAAQLAQEMREFFPDNRVEYFVSYYDYYQPEAYIPSSDTYIEKDSSINEEIDRLRHSATAALLTRRDVIVVASVSCIYGMGDPAEYQGNLVELHVGVDYDMRTILRRLVDLQYDRNDMTLGRGKFRVRGDTIEVHPAYEESVLRIEMFGDTVDRLTVIDPLTGETLRELSETIVFPATHYVAGHERMAAAMVKIERELQERLAEFEAEGKLLEAQRLRMRTQYDLEMMSEVGYCNGIENYSMHIDGRAHGEPPFTLLDYFPDDYLLVIDESHVAVPQLHGQFAGDRSRKDVLVEHGFRLPSARDNRPLTFEEVLERVNQCVFLSATPSAYELRVSTNVVEQIVRPTGLVDPEVIVRPTKGQIDDLIEMVNGRVERGDRILVTTLTKKMAEDLTDYLLEQGLRVRYLHSNIDTIQRIEILRGLRLGDFDVLVGINLLREGLDLPEVSLVAIPRRPRRPRAQPQERRPRPAARQAHRLHRAVGVGQVVASPSTRSTPRASAATSSRCRPTPASSSARWTSPTSTSSRGCRRPSRSTRSRLSRNPRSTVGTITEVYDYLRLLYARIGVPHCPELRHPITRQTPSRSSTGPRAARGHPLPGARPGRAGRKGEYDTAARRPGRRRATPGPASTARSTSSTETSRRPGPLRAAHHRGRRRPLVVREGIERASPTRSRRRCSWPRAWPRSSSCPATARAGRAARAEAETLTFSQHLACPNCGKSFDELAPRNFSFNSPYGACETCDGLGTSFEVDPELVVPDPDLSIAEGAIAPWAQRAQSQYFSAARGGRRGPRHRPTRRGGSCPPSSRRCCCTAAGGRKVRSVQEPLRPQRSYRPVRGRHPVPPAPPRRDRVRHQREQIEGYMREVPCPPARRPAQAAVAGGHGRRRNIAELCACRSARRPKFLAGSSCPSATADRRAGAQGDQRPLGFLLDVGLDYLTLDRSPGTLAGGEAQRIRLATQIGSAWWACSTCSTSRRSACTSATTSGSSTPSSGCATSATP